ncbi:GAF domain-containing protein [Pleurocapsa sp. PCC 7327]|uniref:GAF domain-containing protein n=1 Tax=Pleurocapsa sp. PCC 7327 TaxID=118163 RepID=UPI00029F894E|nr:GAF domain-containing protein [Pleurocapsa sp. PCC 7327]AFY75552.1 GAF domain-containing protein [Pleurocapsa sp. PCC 7327]
MTQLFSPDPNSDKDPSGLQLHRDEISSQLQAEQESALSLTVEENEESSPAEDLPTLEPPKISLKAKVAALAGIAVMLPVLAVGTATYYFGNRAISEQTILSRRADTTGVVEPKLVQQKRLLATLLIGTGGTALLGGALAALLARRTFRSAAIADAATVERGDEEGIQLIREGIQPPHPSYDSEEILKMSVEEVRKTLNCDRVVVYSLDQDSYGIVAAESVLPGYPQALGRKIEDPCFEARYLDKYKNGRVRALDNIYEAGMTPCYIEQLETLEVKANLVAPILNEGKLFGLLVAHQCSGTRTWQQKEIVFVTQMAAQMGFMLDYAKLVGDRDRLQKQAEIEAQWTQYFTDAIQHIRSSLNREDILEVSTEEVRRVLNCDRVVVYSLDRNSYGVVIAESVAPGWSRALGRTIEDPCFEARYLEKYKNGRVRALNNIRQAGMTPCYIEQLETLEVKANLVAPILNEGKLFGLLVAHQCSEPRIWKQYEIRWVAQSATQVGFALDNANLLANATRLQQQLETETQWTQYFTDAIQYIRSSLNREDILEVSTEEVRRVLNCDRVVVYSLDSNSYGVVVAESVLPGYPKALGRTIEDPCFEARYLDKYKNGRVRALNNIRQAGMTPCYIEQLETLEVKANLVVPILNEGKLFGLLVAHQCSSPREWKQHEIRWVAQIATQIGFALDNAKLLVNSTHLQQQAAIETQLTQQFTDAIQHIRSSLNREDILEVSTEEVRRVLNCDRVVIYSLDRNSYGVVIAESVAPGWSRALGRTIEDPCFEARYLEKYKNGRVRALNNIREAGMTQCYIEQLETLQVKANLVTPLLNEGKLFGLLVAHQCSEPRVWQQLEIRWVTQIATQVGFALDNATLLRQLETEGMQNRLLKNFTLRIREKLNEKNLLKVTVEETRKAIGTDRAIVYRFDANWEGTVVAESVLPSFPRALRATIKDPCFAKEYAQKYRDGRIRAIDNIYEADLTECHREQLEAFAVKANLVAPILTGDRLYGLLIVHQCSAPRNWQNFEIDLLTQLALQTGLALDRASLLKEVEQARQLAQKASQEQLRQKELLAQQISELLSNSKTAFDSLCAKITRHSQAIADFLAQMQAVTDSIREKTTSLKQVKLQQGQSSQTVPTEQKNVDWVEDSIATIEETIAEATEKMQHLSQSYQQLFEMVNFVNDLRGQMNYPLSNVSVESERGEEVSQSSIVSIGRTVSPLTHRLAKQTAQIESLIREIDIEANDEQAQSLAFINQFVREIASLASQISEQSMAVTESFNKLAEFAQDLPTDTDLL